MTVDLNKQGERFKMLLGQLVELRDKERLLIDELQTIVEGGEPIGALLKHATAHFAELWTARYGGAYVWQHTRDQPQMKRLIKQLGAADVEDRMLNYIRNGDDFFKQRKHPFTLFVSTVNQHASKGTEPASIDLEPEAVDCHHIPKCRSDQEHTRRRQEEMRPGQTR
jgi:hypothetical protein